MRAPKFDLLAQSIRMSAPIGAFTGAALDKDVRAAETVLDVQFSISYKWFLLTYGSADWPDYIYGLGCSVMDGFNVVNATLRERISGNPIPDWLVPFSPDGAGNHYCLDTSASVDGEAPVVIWLHDANPARAIERTHDSFDSWLTEYIESDVD